MTDGRIPRNVLDGLFGGKKMLARPRIQREEIVLVDANNLLSIRNWRTMARRRDDWKAMVQMFHRMNGEETDFSELNIRYG